LQKSNIRGQASSSSSFSIFDLYFFSFLDL
jgi:hypothetical protein